MLTKRHADGLWKSKGLGLPLMYFMLLTMMTWEHRAQAQSLEFTGKSSKLTKATGWELNKETNTWIENFDVIDDRESPPYWAGHTAQSFTWLRFASIRYGDKEYHVFLFEKKSGKYKNEANLEDWEPETRTYFYIFDEQDFIRIKSMVQDNKESQLKFGTKLSGYMSDQEKGAGGSSLYHERYLLTRISKCLDKPGSLESCMVVSLKNVSGKPAIRFLLPTSCFIVENLLKTSFFEVSQTDFQKLFELTKSPAGY